MNQRVGLMPSTAPRRVHLAGVSQMGRSFRHGVCAYSPETYSRLLAELHHSRAARIRVAGGGAGGDAPDAQASALGLPYGQPQPPKRLSPSWDTTNHGGVQREVSLIHWGKPPPLAVRIDRALPVPAVSRWGRSADGVRP